MGNVEVEARLDLIQIAASVISVEQELENEELADLIEALCRRRDLPMATTVSEENAAMLWELARPDLAAWVAKHGISLPGLPQT